MSNDYDVYCIYCAESLGICDANHERDVMRALVRLAPAFAAFGRALGAEQGRHEVSVHVLYSKNLDLTWFVRHDGHKLAARDEYGKVDDECGQHYDCYTCGHMMWCHRMQNHEGPHADKRDDK